MAYKHSYEEYNGEKMARALGYALPVSRKQSIEICSSLRNKPLVRAKAILNDAISMRKAIPFRRFTSSISHKKGMGPGKYPINAATEILKLVENAEANAKFKGLNASNLIIKHMCAQHGGNVWKAGRFRRRKMKRTHIEIVVTEGKAKKESKKKEKKEVANK